MKHRIVPILICLTRFTLVLLLTVLSQQTALALGTGAGVDISNTATVDYVMGGSPASINSNTITFRVDEKLDVNVAWQDGANVFVNTPDNNQVLSYLLTNTGNGNDSYTLSIQNTLGGDQFDPVPVDIYLDANANGIFESGIDTLYIPGSNDPVLAADASLAVFVRNNIPNGLNSGDLGNSQLTATSNTLSGAPGTFLANAGDNNTFAVVGASGATDSAVGTYEINGTNVSCVVSEVGGDQRSPGRQPADARRHHDLPDRRQCYRAGYRHRRGDYRSDTGEYHLCRRNFEPQCVTTNRRYRWRCRRCQRHDAKHAHCKSG